MGPNNNKNNISIVWILRSKRTDYAQGRETQKEIENIVARIKLIRKKYLCKLWEMYIHRNRCVFIFFDRDS